MSTAIQPDTDELLILTKTYPSPSAGHRETTCVAAVNRAGELRHFGRAGLAEWLRPEQNHAVQPKTRSI